MDIDSEIASPPYTERDDAPPYTPESESQTYEQLPPAYEVDNAPPARGIDQVEDEAAHMQELEPQSRPPTRSPQALPLAASSAADSDPLLHAESRSSFIKNMAQSYTERKRVRQAQKKVDFYEKVYGFVPKNVMSEAEWKRARKAAQKGKPSQLKATVFFGPRD